MKESCPLHVAALRDALQKQRLGDSSIRRKLTTLRSLFSYLRSSAFLGANPADSDFFEAPAVPRDGKTFGLTPDDCRGLTDAPDAETPADVRDQALLTILVYSACHVDGLARLRVGDTKCREWPAPNCAQRRP